MSDPCAATSLRVVTDRDRLRHPRMVSTNLATRSHVRGSGPSYCGEQREGRGL